MTEKFQVLDNGVLREATEDEISEILQRRIVDIQKLKQTKRNEINESRLKANFSSFKHAGKDIACDTLSRSDIDAVMGVIALTNALPEGWMGAWKAMDNTYVAIATVDDFKAFYASMVAAGSANFAKAQSMKAAVDAATTPEEVNSINW